MAISVYICVLVGRITELNILLVLTVNITYYYLISNTNQVRFFVKIVLGYLFSFAKKIYKISAILYTTICTHIIAKYNNIANFIYSIKYNTSYIIRMISRISKKPFIVIIKLLLRYFIRSEFIISFKFAAKYPISFYYFVIYNQSMPFLIIYIIRIYNFIFFNQESIQDILYELKILENYVYILGDNPFEGVHSKGPINNPQLPKIPKPNDYIVISDDSDSSEDENVVERSTEITNKNNVTEGGVLNKSTKIVQDNIVYRNNIEPINKGKNRMPTDREYELKQTSIRKMLSISNLIELVNPTNAESSSSSIPNPPLSQPNSSKIVSSEPAQSSPNSKVNLGQTSTKNYVDTNPASNSHAGNYTNNFEFINTGPIDYRSFYPGHISHGDNDDKYLTTLTNDDLLLYHIEADSSSSGEDFPQIDSFPNTANNSSDKVKLFVNTTFLDYKHAYQYEIRAYNHRKMNPTNDFAPDYSNIEFATYTAPTNYLAGPLDTSNLKFVKNLEPRHLDSLPIRETQIGINYLELNSYLNKFSKGTHDSDCENVSNKGKYSLDKMYARKHVGIHLELYDEIAQSSQGTKSSTQELEKVVLRAPNSSPTYFAESKPLSERDTVVNPLLCKTKDNPVVTPKAKFVDPLVSKKYHNNSKDYIVNSDDESHDSLYSVSSDEEKSTKKGSKNSIPKYTTRNLRSNSKVVISSSSENSDVFQTNLTEEDDVDNNVYEWVSDTTDRLRNIYNFANVKHPKLDFCTFTGDYLDGSNDYTLDIFDDPVEDPSMLYGYNKFLNIFYKYNDDISGVLPWKKYYDYMCGARSNYKISDDMRLTKVSLGDNQLEMEYPICFSSYIQTVDGADASDLNIYNLRNKSHIRDINRVFNNYYSPGYIPKDVYPNLWLEDAYKFLLKSKFDVNRLPDGTYEYIVNDLSFTSEEEESIEKEWNLLNENKEGRDEHHEKVAISDQIAKIRFYADYIKKGIVEKGEWLFKLGYFYDDDKKLNSSSLIFKEWTSNNIYEAWKDTICVLNKHFIVNNPIWPSGLQDRRWFGVGHDRYNKLHNKTGVNDLLKLDDLKYRSFYNLSSPSQNSTENLEYKYPVDISWKYNRTVYKVLTYSDLSFEKRLFIDAKAWGEKTSSEIAFENNPLYPERFKGNETLYTPYIHDYLHKTNFQNEDMPDVDIEDTLKSLSFDRSDKKSYLGKLSRYVSPIIRVVDGMDLRYNKAMSKASWYDSFSLKKHLPKLDTKPWTHKMPSSADDFTEDRYLWENPYCKGLVPKEFTYSYDLPKIDFTKFIKVDVETWNPMYPSGTYIYSKHPLREVFSDYESIMKWTKETCKLIDKNNTLLYYNLFHNDSKNLCLPCADKVVTYNESLKMYLTHVANTQFHENIFSHMKKTMEGHYLLYTKRADSLEASYDKLMTRLATNIEPEKVWTKVELKKEELKYTTYEERKFFRYLVLRDFEYAMKYNEKFDIRGTLLSEEKARNWDKGDIIEKSIREKMELMKRVANMVGKPNTQTSYSSVNE